MRCHDILKSTIHDGEEQGPRTGIKVDFRGEFFEVLGEEKGDRVWGKSRCLEGRVVLA